MNVDAATVFNGKNLRGHLILKIMNKSRTFGCFEETNQFIYESLRQVNEFDQKKLDDIVSLSATHECETNPLPSTPPTSFYAGHSKPIS